MNTYRRIQGAYEKISDAQEQKIAIVHESTWIPGKHEYADGNNNAEEFSDAVEEQVAVKARKVEPEQKQYAQKDPQNALLFNHRHVPS